MSNQPFYPAQQNPSDNPNEVNPASNTSDNSYPSSDPNYSRDYPVQTPQPSAYGNVGNNDSPYAPSQQSANSYGSPNVTSASETYDPYANSGNTYGQQDPYAASAASANSWDNANQMNSQPAPQSYQQQDNQQSQNYQQNYQQSQDLNIKALLGLIFSFFFFPAGLILSWMGFRETRNTSDSTGRVMSIIGLVVSGFQTVLFVLWIVLFVFLMLLGMSGV